MRWADFGLEVWWKLGQIWPNFAPNLLQIRRNFAESWKCEQKKKKKSRGKSVAVF